MLFAVSDLVREKSLQRAWCAIFLSFGRGPRVCELVIAGFPAWEMLQMLLFSVFTHLPNFQCSVCPSVSQRRWWEFHGKRSRVTLSGCANVIYIIGLREQTLNMASSVYQWQCRANRSNKTTFSMTGRMTLKPVTKPPSPWPRWWKLCEIYGLIARILTT